MNEGQTQFSSGSLLYETVADDLESEDQPNLPSQQEKDQARKKWVWLGVGLIVLVLLLVAVLAMVRSGPTVEKTQEPTPEPITNSALTDPFRRRLNELDQELKLAEPSQEELPFPPVEMGLNL